MTIVGHTDVVKDVAWVKKGMTLLKITGILDRNLEIGHFQWGKNEEWIRND
jgi:hypothetical protein